MLGDRDTRRLYAALVVVPLLFSAAAAFVTWPVVFGLVATPLVVLLTRQVLGGAEGKGSSRFWERPA